MYAYMANMTQRLERMERNNNHGHPQSHVEDTELKEKMREVINEIEINKYMEAKFNPLPTSDKNLLAQYKTLKATLTTSDLNNKERVTATISESEGTQLVRERRRAHILRVLRVTQRPLNHAINSDNGGEEETTENLKNIVMDTTKRLQHATQSCSRLKTIIETLNMDNMKLREEADSNHKEMLELLEENTMLKTKNNELQTKNNSLRTQLSKVKMIQLEAPNGACTKKK
ncbi:hypothetical protein C9374_008092 [Naegleria lovaniensis]|uniref:Uncharacterized protein n=1 Tax=Naegleria lovaniensis TaxID=51637 RepID=A0AA88GH54_NAELO|nr:uncharacterized protein C9374_008092 [Naegleria lovaniensis]KAG2378453.1 hypothetical protein C9374_008092 [Naegleria lovaniensis]